VEQAGRAARIWDGAQQYADGAINATRYRANVEQDLLWGQFRRGSELFLPGGGR
jgi:hypothetical protein